MCGKPGLKLAGLRIFIAVSGHKKFRMRPAAPAIAHDRLSRYFSRVCHRVRFRKDGSGTAGVRR